MLQYPCSITSRVPDNPDVQPTIRIDSWMLLGLFYPSIICIVNPLHTNEWRVWSKWLPQPHALLLKLPFSLLRTALATSPHR